MICASHRCVEPILRRHIQCSFGHLTRITDLPASDGLSCYTDRCRAIGLRSLRSLRLTRTARWTSMVRFTRRRSFQEPVSSFYRALAPLLLIGFPSIHSNSIFTVGSEVLQAPVPHVVPLTPNRTARHGTANTHAGPIRIAHPQVVASLVMRSQSNLSSLVRRRRRGPPPHPYAFGYNLTSQESLTH